MHDIILYLSETVPFDEKQLACAGLDGVDTLVIGNAPEQCVKKRCFARGGSTRDHKADAVSDAHFEEFHDFLGCHSAVNKAFAVHTLWVQETNGNGNAAILIHNGTLDRRNTGTLSCSARYFAAVSLSPRYSSATWREPVLS